MQTRQANQPEKVYTYPGARGVVSLGLWRELAVAEILGRRRRILADERDPIADKGAPAQEELCRYWVEIVSDYLSDLASQFGFLCPLSDDGRLAGTSTTTTVNLLNGAGPARATC